MSARLSPEATICKGPDGVFVIDPDGVERARPLKSEAGGEVAKGVLSRNKIRLPDSCRRCVTRTIPGRGEVCSPLPAAKQLFVRRFWIVSFSASNNLLTPRHRSQIRRGPCEPGRRHYRDAIPHWRPRLSWRDRVDLHRRPRCPRPGRRMGIRSRNEEAKNDGVAVLKMIDPRSGATVDIGMAARRAQPRHGGETKRRIRRSRVSW